MKKHNSPCKHEYVKRFLYAFPTKTKLEIIQYDKNIHFI